MVWEKVWQELKNIAINLISNAIWEIVAGVAVVILSGSILNITPGSVIALYLIWILLIVALVVLAREHKDDKYEYKMESRCVEFEYNGDHNVYKNTIEVVSLKDGLDRIGGKFMWWYGNNAEIKCKNPDGAEIQICPQDDAYTNYEARFQRQYNWGEMETIAVEGVMKGEVQFPLLATIICKPTGQLEMKIKIPLEVLKNRQVLCKTKMPLSNGGKILTEKKMFEVDDGNGICTWPIDDPKLGYEYIMKWNFTDEKMKQIEQYKKAFGQVKMK